MYVYLQLDFCPKSTHYCYTIIIMIWLCYWLRVRLIVFLLFQFVLMFSIIIHTPVTYGTYIYPGWAIAIGWLFALCSIIPLPSVAIYKVMHETGPIRQVSNNTLV